MRSPRRPCFSLLTRQATSPERNCSPMVASRRCESSFGRAFVVYEWRLVMTSQRSVVFAEPIRTAISTFGGSLKDIPAPALGATAIGAAVARAGIDPSEVETVVLGNVVQAGAKMNPARQAAVHAGLPVTVPAMTVNRVCGSGAQAIVSAAQEIALGNIDVAVAGGMENMDLAPYL